MNAKLNRKTLTLLIAGLSGAGLWWWWNWADMFASGFTTFAHNSFFVLFPLLVIIALAGLSFAAFSRGAVEPKQPYRPYAMDSATFDRKTATYEAKKVRFEKFAKLSRIVGSLLVVVTLAAIGFTIKFWWTHSYNVDRQYVGAIEIVETTSPTFDERVAYPVAKASAKNNLRDVTGDLQGVRYVSEDSTWNALVNRRTRWYEGAYEVVQEQNLPLAGSAAQVTFCSFDTAVADRRLDGAFSSSLERAIFHQARGTTFDEGDAYGLCLDEDHPVVVVPLVKIEGWFYAHAVPAGVAVYDGLTGEVKILDEIKPGQLAGPVYPMSLAKRTREAAVSLGTWSERKRTGFDETTDTENSSEFSLAQAGGGSYVTALTPRGSSESITAEGVVASDRVVAGQLNTLKVYKLAETRISGNTMEKTVRADFSNLEWAAGLTMYEITPVSDTEWVASLGMEQKVKYRVRIQANGNSCLEAADGTELRCSTDVDTHESDDTNGDSSTEIPATNTELQGLTNEQLVELQTQVTREVLRRVNSGKHS